MWAMTLRANIGVRRVGELEKIKSEIKRGIRNDERPDVMRTYAKPILTVSTY
jgi:hypothetical protein